MGRIIAEIYNLVTRVRKRRTILIILQNPNNIIQEKLIEELETYADLLLVTLGDPTMDP